MHFEEEKKEYARKLIDTRYNWQIETLDKYLNSYHATLLHVSSDDNEMPKICRVFIDNKGMLSFVIDLSYKKDIDLYVLGGCVAPPMGTSTAQIPKLHAKIRKEDGLIILEDIICGEYGGNGYGTVLMEELLKIAELNRVKKIVGELSPFDEIDPVNYERRDAFYKKMGFEIVDGKVIKTL